MYRALWLAPAFVFAACTNGAQQAPHEDVGEAQSAAFVNGDFEAGAAGMPPPSWTVNRYINNGITPQNPQTLAGLNLLAGGVANTVTLNAPGGPGTQSDLALGAAGTLRWPRYGNKCVVVNGPNAAATFTAGANQNVNELTQTMTIGAGDVDPSDSQVHIRFAVAPVLQNPSHTAVNQPYYFILVTNLTKANTILYRDFNLSGAAIPWKIATIGGLEYDYTDWQLVDIAPGAAGVAMGDMVKLQIIAAGCQQTGHWGEIYVDGVGATVPGLSVQGTGPAQANAGTNVTYTFTYKNGSAPAACTTSANCTPNTEACVGGFCAETNVVINFTTPANTTFQSITPPAGATCTTLPVGGTGTITCTFTNPVPPGTAGTFTVTVAVNAAAPSPITCANYEVHSTQETPLLGTPIVTVVGCTKDADCSAGNWCKEAAPSACTPKLANGTAIPTDAPHTAPTLNGMCTAAAAALVCASGVCDTDNKCGLLNNDGPCTVANGGTVCRSGVCDPDLKCGYANGDGPCTAANQGTVCRSATCSVNLLCEPAGGCNVDLDCTGGKWCLETTHTCTAKLANGTALPNDPPHTGPTLNATCTAAAATLVCASGVCDTADNKCGYANGDGPCTVANGGTVCRSGACSVNLLCEPAGGCNVDADCSGGNWCNETTHTCSPKLANGTALPNDPPHTGPTLDGTCTAAAGALVCASGVCDATDNKCGLLNNDGPCTVANGSVVCRSGVCDPDLKCGYAVNDGPCTAANQAVVCRSTACSVNGVCAPLGGCNVDGDCTGGNWCLETTHTCTAKLPNSTPIPTDAPHTGPTLDGTCTAAAATLVCASGVCDTADNKCGYASGDGPCTLMNGGTVCRSGACSTNGLCLPPGGCNVDLDCTGGDWCNESAHMCTPKLANGAAMPTDGPHTGPTLDGTCTAAAATLVCASGVCDTADNKCGYANGDGPCTVATGSTVCRSGACSVNGLCEPAGGCNVDGDCSTGNWCNETAHMCVPTLANGTAIPTDAPHANPTLDGTCTGAAATLVCQSGVCDTADNKCGYANGDGPCTVANGGTVCRSGACSTNGLCEPAGGCNVDADCSLSHWCNESMNACLPTLPNGTVVPNDPPHMGPTLNGMCTAAAGALVCTSGVCDAKDNECGYPNGDGPCTVANGDAVCRSGICATSGPNTGNCVACVMDSQCPGGVMCNTTTNTCVQCVDSSQCSGSTPICDVASATCVECDGDLGSGTKNPCSATGAPFCFLSGPMDGACGKCAMDADCQGHKGNLCDTTTGLCVSGCKADADCMSTDWCDAAAGAIGMCVPKLPNGTPLPSKPSDVATCSAAVGKRVCVSGACDPKDDACGLAAGDGPCTNANQCRNDMCDLLKQTCSPPGCKTDADCPKADFCRTSDGTCTPKLPDGSTCAGPNQCQSGDCADKLCNGIIASGNGLVCTVGEPGSSGGDATGLLGLVLAAAGSARRRRRS